MMRIRKINAIRVKWIGVIFSNQRANIQILSILLLHPERIFV